MARRTAVRIDTSALRKHLEEKARAADRKAAEVLDRVGERAVEILRSHTSARTEDGRPEHPGGWADITGETADAYRYEVRSTSSGPQLAIINDAEHAEVMEQLEGIFLVKGFAESEHVRRALKKAVAEVAPEWEVTRGRS